MKVKPTLCFVISGSGGVGKSTFSRVLAYYLRDILAIRSYVTGNLSEEIGKRKPAVRLIDYDADNSNLARCEPSSVEYDLKEADELEDSCELFQYEADFIIADTPAGSVNSIIRNLGGAKAFSKLTTKYQVIAFLVVNATEASKKAVKDFNTTWKDFRKVVVLSEHAETFDFRHLRLEHKTETIQFELMPKPLFMRVDKHNKGFSDYLNIDKNKDKVHVENFLKRSCEQIRKIFIKT